MSPTYTKLLNDNIPSTAQKLVSEETGTIVYWTKSKTTDLISVGLIDSFLSKKVTHYYIKDNEMDKIEKLFVRIVERESRLLKERKERSHARMERKKEFLSKLKVGTILHGSWGYEQTNCEFFIVREIKGSKVKLQELGHKIVKETSWASANVLPSLDNPVGEVIERTVASDSIQYNSSCSLYLWDGRECYSSWYY